MSVADLRSELKARGINSKGLKSQLIAKMTKALKAESEKSDDSKDSTVDVDMENVDEKKAEVCKKKRNQRMDRRQALLAIIIPIRAAYMLQM